MKMEITENLIWYGGEEGAAEFAIENRTLVIYLKEDLDHHNSLWLRDKADKILEQKDILNIIFDFQNVSFMDSSGIGVIMGRYKRVIFLGGKIAVTGVNDSVNRIFILSGLYKIMGKYQAVEDALRVL